MKLPPMITIKLDLPDAMQHELEVRIRETSYANVDDYVRDLIKSDLEQEDGWITPEIAAAIDEGESSGFEPLDMQSIIAEARAEFHGE